MTPTDWADAVMLAVALGSAWLILYAPIPGAGDDE